MSKIKNTIKSTVDAFRHFAVNRSGRANVDSSWSTRLCYYYLDMFSNSEDYKWQLEQGRIYDSNIIDQDYDVLPCVELEEVDQQECPCAPAAGCMFLKGKEPIPEMVIRDNDPVFTDTLGMQKFSYVRWYSFSKKINSRYEAQNKRPYFTFKHVDGKTWLYVYNRDFLKMGSLTARFVNPVEVAEFPRCGKDMPNLACSVLDQPFEIRREIKDAVFAKTFNLLMNMRNSTPTDDIINDDSDDTASQPRI